MARDGTLYFSSTRDAGATGAIQVYRSRRVNGAWTAPENVSRLINGPDTSAYYDLDVTIFPDTPLGRMSIAVFVCSSGGPRWSQACQERLLSCVFAEDA